MAMNDLINPRCYHQFLSFFPEWFGAYAAIHLDTIPKFLNHVLWVMFASNTFLLLATSSIHLMVFFLAFLLFLQNLCVLLILNNGKMALSPRFLAPTEFMVGVGLGISIGATILSLFLSLIYGKLHEYCDYVNKEGEQAEQRGCGNVTSTINAIWFWSSLVFWLDMITCILLAVGRQEIAYQSQHQYESIDSANSMDNAYPMDEYQQANATRFQESQAQPMNAASSTYGGGSYSTVPDVQASNSSKQPKPSGFAQTLSV